MPRILGNPNSPRRLHKSYVSSIPSVKRTRLVVKRLLALWRQGKIASASNATPEQLAEARSWVAARNPDLFMAD